MDLKLNITLLFIFGLFNSVFSQDKLIKNDGTELQVNIVEINATEIKYKRFDNPDGPLYISLKSDFVSAEFNNGVKETFKDDTPESQVKPALINTPTSHSNDVKIGDWIKFNVEAGVTYNRRFNGIPVRINGSDRHGNGNDYSKNSLSDKYHISPYVALNCIFGKDKIVKHILGVSYLNVKTNYDLVSSSGFTPSYGSNPPPYYAQSTYVSVSGDYHIMAINCGINFTVAKGLNISLISSLGSSIKGTTVSNGYRTDYITLADTVYPGYSTHTETVLIENEKSNVESVGFYSGQAKIHYNFKVKNNVFGVFVLGSASLKNRLPYCAIGLTYYPFKKLWSEDL